jgi:hypothetical protein
VSVYNFHYAKPPVTVEMNYGLNKPIGDNETGFSGTEDVHYRTEGWDFMAAGGALYNNLDYSFTTENEDGSFMIPSSQPGGGGEKLRGQLNTIKTVFGELDFINMKPVNYTLQPDLPEKATVRILAEAGTQYLVYFNNWHPKKGDLNDTANMKTTGYKFPLDLQSGTYSCEWIDPPSGNRMTFMVKNHKGGIYQFQIPFLEEDIALKIIR